LIDLFVDGMIYLFIDFSIYFLIFINLFLKYFLFEKHNIKEKITFSTTSVERRNIVQKMELKDFNSQFKSHSLAANSVPFVKITDIIKRLFADPRTWYV
jgi:hypothetical protein